MAAKLRLGLIGCGGNMRGAHLPRVKAARRVELVAVADPSAAAAERLLEAFGQARPVYANYRKMLRDEELDALLISTPHSQHYGQIRYLLEHRYHVLVEKPMVIKPAHAKALLTLARRKRRVLHVAYQRHHYPDYRYARDLIAKGKIGKIRAVVAYVTQGWARTGGWRKDPELAGGGMFMDTGSHLVGAVLFLTGLHPESVTALMDNAGFEVDINAIVAVRFRGGALGSLNTIGNASRHDERLAIHGDKGVLVFHLHQWRINSVRLNNEPVRVPRSYKNDTPDAAFFRWCAGGKGYQAPTYALEVARLSEAAYRSVKLKRPVKVRR